MYFGLKKKKKKGLILNFIDVHWPELLKLGFCIEFITPIVKAKKGKEVKSFYTLPEYEAWKVFREIDFFVLLSSKRVI